MKLRAAGASEEVLGGRRMSLIWSERALPWPSSLHGLIWIYKSVRHLGQDRRAADTPARGAKNSLCSALKATRRALVQRVEEFVGWAKKLVVLLLKQILVAGQSSWDCTLERGLIIYYWYKLAAYNNLQRAGRNCASRHVCVSENQGPRRRFGFFLGGVQNSGRNSAI